MELNADLLMKSENVYSPNKQAWIRLFARCIDMYLNLIGFIILMILLFSCSILNPLSLPKSNLVLGMICLLVGAFIETIFLSSWGTTPGKWLLNTKVENFDGKKLSFSQALTRSLFVFVKGLAIGIPYLYLFSFISAHSDLTKRGATSWDKKGNFKITHRKISAIKCTCAVALLAVPFFLIIFLFALAGADKLNALNETDTFIKNDKLLLVG